jgi:hypothetical protein
MGDRAEERSKAAAALSSVSGMVGGDQEGRTFARWYQQSFLALTNTVAAIAHGNFATAADIRDFEKAWDLLEKNIISTLPTLSDVDVPRAPTPPPLPKET